MDEHSSGRRSLRHRSWKFVEHPYYGLMLMDPFVLIVFYLAFYGGGLAVLIGLGMAAREITKR